MKLLGEPIFARDETGRLKSKIGTIFLRTPGLVTHSGVHATQRLDWIKALNRERQSAGQPALTNDEIDAEMAHSVDLLFDDQHVLIRPDPYAMDLAFEADELLQSVVSKRKIRYLNTQNERVRSALRAHGEYWRMSRIPVSSEEMNRLIATARTPIDGLPLYFYNRSTGTRFLTLGTLEWLAQQPADIFRRHLAEIAQYSARRNRFGYPEIDIFPPGCAFTRQAFEALNAEGLKIDALQAAFRKLLDAFRLSVTETLQDETPENIEWRNLMCSALIMQPNAVAAEDVLQGISPEFYMQIEWLPGCRIENGELIFDSLYEEREANPDDLELRSLCDPRAKAVIFNYLREFGTIEHINIGRIGRSLSARVHGMWHRPNVYVIQVKEAGRAEPELRILRFQKWGVAERLDENKELLRAMIESADYTDYILDRRLGCRQLGMNLPQRVTTGSIQETYSGQNAALHGTHCWAVYFERCYVNGCATDKILPRRYASAEFNRRLARLLGEAAAVNCVVGRANLEKTVMFDDGDEVIVLDAAGMPDHLIVADHTGSFAQYELPLVSDAQAYAVPVNKRARHMANASEFATFYVDAFQDRFVRIQQEYRRRKRAFDSLFKHRPLDKAGSIAYRWLCTLERLNSTDAAALAQAIRRHIVVLNS